MPTVTGKATDFITFTRASNATVTDADGKIKWAPHNLLTNSESFDASSWTKTNATVTGNSVVAPNGSTTAEFLVPTTSGGAHRVQQLVAPGTQGVAAIYAKAGGYNWIVLQVSSASSGCGYWFNVSTGAVGTISAYGTGFTSSNPIVTSMGNGWYKCEFTYVTDGTGDRYLAVAASGDNVSSFAGDGISGVYLWGAHLYRSDLGGMQANTSAYPMYNPTTPKNLLGYTEAFSDSYWNKGGTSVDANQALAPNGLPTADFLKEDSGNSQHRVFIASSFTIVSGSRYAQTVYAKAATRSQLFMRVAGGTNDSNGAIFDLAAQTTATVGTIVSASITSVGDGWFRCCLISNATSTAFNCYIGLSSNGSLSYQGDGSSGLYLWGAQLSDSASLDAYVPSYGAAVTSAAYYGPRRDFDPVTLACKGLLVEEQRTNLITQSGFTNGLTDAGTRGGLLTATTFYNYLSNTSIAFGYDGSTLSYAYNSMTPAASTAYVFSTFVRMDDGNAPSFGSATVTSNLNDFAVVVGGALANMATAAITNVGNSVYRVSVAVTTGGSPISGVGVLKYNTNSTRTFRVTGYQLEAGSFATSYIPTGAATATRSADVASVSTQAFPYSATEGTVVVSINAADNKTLASLSDGTGNNRMSSAAGGQYHLYVASGGVEQANIDAGTFTPNTIGKLAFVYATNDFAAVINGGTVATDSSGAVPAVNKLSIGMAGDNTGQINGWVRQITYIPRRLSNAELQSRSA